MGRLEPADRDARLVTRLRIGGRLAPQLSDVSGAGPFLMSCVRPARAAKEMVRRLAIG
jgi:hypothetical protein